MPPFGFLPPHVIGNLFVVTIRLLPLQGATVPAITECSCNQAALSDFSQ